MSDFLYIVVNDVLPARWTARGASFETSTSVEVIANDAVYEDTLLQPNVGDVLGTWNYKGGIICWYRGLLCGPGGAVHVKINYQTPSVSSPESESPKIKIRPYVHMNQNNYLRKKKGRS